MDEWLNYTSIYAETRPIYPATRVKKHDIMYAPATI
jgi:hypothetical protein